MIVPKPLLEQYCCEVQADMYQASNPATINQAALAHLGERQTEVHFKSRITANSGGTVFDPQKRHSTPHFCEVSAIHPPSFEDILHILAGAIGSAFGCYSTQKAYRKVSGSSPL